MIFTGPHAPTPVPEVAFTSFVLGGAGRHPDRVAVVDVTGQDSLTYGELVAAVGRVAGALAARGLGRGDVVAVLAPNVPQYPVVFHAGAAVGATVMVLNPLDTTADLVDHLNTARAALLVTTEEQALLRAKDLTAGTGVKEVVVFGHAPGTTPFAELLDHTPFAEILDHTPDQPRDQAADQAPAGGPDGPRPGGGGGAVVGVDAGLDVVALLHSSGSTGRPKGVMLTHRNMNANVLQTCTAAPLEDAERVLAVAPFHHAFGLIMVMNASLRQGATVVTLPRFDPQAYLQAIQDHRITRLYVVPTIAVLLARSPLVDRYDLSSVRTVVSGGAALDPQIARLCEERLDCRVRQGYGLTEGLVSFMQVDGSPAASVGRAAPNIEFKIVDITTGRALGPGEDGEVLVRGPHVMRGYLHAPQATREALRRTASCVPATWDTSTPTANSSSSTGSRNSSSTRDNRSPPSNSKPS
ncbi:AMP-binding protein [Kitasatospora sp. NBC_00240]|uniref:AMP-binding protein n=1 Tax=Kitasatospora sp. NBC_00240 TaxID=2903567 RepID=UPI00225942AA|nr:AMP-binding protein [Kitasatospora sp. NBC_00240]MCX5215217.1 AMP-binding protein [Kitasatospora sp. NBC_00240]